MYDLNPPEREKENKLAGTFEDTLEGDYFGIHLEYSSDSNITGNYFNPESNSVIYGGGITVDSSDRIVINENIVKNIRIDITSFEYLEIAGIILRDVSYATIDNNTVEKTDKDNLSAVGCNNLIITNNNFSESQSAGINILSSSDIDIINNTIQYHPSYGVNIQSGSSNVIIHHNHFIDNNIGGSQASDSGSNNVWYDIDTMQGNWWNDWTGGDYVIDGSAGSLDIYPLGVPIVVAEFAYTQSVTYLVLLSSVLIIVSVVIKKKK